MKTGREIFEARYRRYQQAEKKEKGNILEEAARTTGLNREHLAHVLGKLWYPSFRLIDKEKQGEGQSETALRIGGWSG
jgi:hypothetical protein